ncbi:MAG: hypothetical protein ACREPW_05340 [Candidatus Binataceae bacterium]
MTAADTARILADVRRLAELIVLCCALGGCARTAAAPPAAAPPQAASEEVPKNERAAEPSAIATPAALHRTRERFGGIPAADSTTATPTRPRFSIEKAIGVTTMRVVRDDSSTDSAAPAKCEVRILRDKPAGKTREVATLNVYGAPAQHEDILSLLKRKACEAGANAVLIKHMDKTRVQGVKADHVEAIALIVGTPKPPVDPSPVPKTITVTPESPAAPKTITVDPGAPP